MQHASEIEILIPGDNDLSKAQISTIAKLINNVYLSSESDFWPQNGDYERTTTEEIGNFIKNKELIIAKLKGILVGAVHVYHIENDICGFGMLVSSPEYRKTGIGSTLMSAVENWARIKHYNIIQLELLRPLHYRHPQKEFLKNWYEKLNYQMVKSATYKDLYPDQAHLLKIQCTFDIYQKNLKK